MGFGAATIVLDEVPVTVPRLVYFFFLLPFLGFSTLDRLNFGACLATGFLCFIFILQL